jgi:hypothetical protein
MPLLPGQQFGPYETMSPFLYTQILNFAEVPITSNQNQLVTCRGRGNPHIIFGKRPPLLPKALPQPAVLTSNLEIARENGSASREAFYFQCVFRRPARFSGAEE